MSGANEIAMLPIASTPAAIKIHLRLCIPSPFRLYDLKTSLALLNAADRSVRRSFPLELLLH